MPKNRCKICRGAVCGFRSRDKDFFSPGSSMSGNRAIGEADPMFTVSYERQQAQDRETIWSILTGGTPPVAQHQGGSQSRGAAPIGSQVSDSTRYGGMPLPYAAAMDGYPTGPTAVPASGGPAPPRIPWSLVGPTCNAIIPRTQPGLAAFTLEGGWVHNSIKPPARPISVIELAPAISGRGHNPYGAIGTHLPRGQAPARQG